MPGQLLPLRLLSSSRLLRSSRGASVLRRALLLLPVQDPAFPSNPHSLDFSAGNPGARPFSSRPVRSRGGFGGGSRDQRKGDPRAGSAGRGRSLIEDEAELSDWVSDLKKDSFRLRLSSDSEDASDRDRSRSSRGRDRDRVRGRGRDPQPSMRNQASSRRQADSDSDGFLEVPDRRRSRSSVGPAARSPRSSLSKGRFDSDLDEEEEDQEDDFPTRQPRGRGRRGGISSPSARRGGRNLDSNYRQERGVTRSVLAESEEEDDDDGDSISGLEEDFLGIKDDEQGGAAKDAKGDCTQPTSSRRRDPLPSMRNQASSRRQVDSDSDRFLEVPESPRYSSLMGCFYSDMEEEEEDQEDDFPTRQPRGRGRRGGISSPSARRGGRNPDSNYRQERGVTRPVLAESEEEDDDVDSISGLEEDFLGIKDDEQGGAAKDAKGDSTQPASRSSIGETGSYLSQTRFDQCSLSPLSLKGIKAAGYERMTIVQEATLPVILKGKDVLARARTGTGKTVAFLLPAIEVVAQLPPADHDQKRRPINVLVICPTRELAAQAAAEADTLLKYHPSIGVQVVTGGTRLALEQKRMQANPCQILVATPGRLRDHIENTPGFATRLMSVKVLVLDEADRLLDMGFRKDIEKIVAAVPRQRQTLLFSATVPEEVRQVCYIAMKRDHEFINTVEEGSEETHSQVRQMHLVAPLDRHFPILYTILTEHISEDVDYKVIVFCTTAMATKLVADFLSELKLNVREIHSRKPQTYRTRVSKEFKESKGLILVSSDVSARGVDYPNVTLVIQVGVPSDREQYIHRLGRTGRKGKEGKGILMLAPWEEFFLDSIKDLPVEKAPLPPNDPDTRKKVERALAHVETKNKESAYQAWLGYYNSVKNVGRDKYKLVLLANEFSRSMGLDNPPAVPNLVLRKMGLTNVPGLRSK